jgi:hypothetical protein
MDGDVYDWLTFGPRKTKRGRRTEARVYALGEMCRALERAWGKTRKEDTAPSGQEMMHALV